MRAIFERWGAPGVSPALPKTGANISFGHHPVWGVKPLLGVLRGRGFKKKGMGQTQCATGVQYTNVFSGHSRLIKFQPFAPHSNLLPITNLYQTAFVAPPPMSIFPFCLMDRDKNLWPGRSHQMPMIGGLDEEAPSSSPVPWNMMGRSGLRLRRSGTPQGAPFSPFSTGSSVG